MNANSGLKAFPTEVEQRVNGLGVRRGAVWIAAMVAGFFLSQLCVVIFPSWGHLRLGFPIGLGMAVTVVVVATLVDLELSTQIADLCNTA